MIIQKTAPYIQVLKIAGLCALLAFTFWACDESSTDPEPIPDILQTTSRDSDLSRISELIVETGVDTVIVVGGPYTLFAPLNSGFEQLPGNFIEELPDSAKREIVLNHLVQGNLASANLESQMRIATINGSTIYLTQDLSGIYLNGVGRVQALNIITRNGVIHTHNTVLLPDRFLNAEQLLRKRFTLSTFVAYLEEHDVLSDIQNENGLTIFAPDNDAFNEFQSLIATDSISVEDMSEVLRHHIVTEQIFISNIEEEAVFQSLSGLELRITNPLVGLPAINEQEIFEEIEIAGTNVVLYTINRVLLDQTDEPDES